MFKTFSTCRHEILPVYRLFILNANSPAWFERFTRRTQLVNIKAAAKNELDVTVRCHIRCTLSISCLFTIEYRMSGGNSNAPRHTDMLTVTALSIKPCRKAAICSYRLNLQLFKDLTFLRPLHSFCIHHLCCFFLCLFVLD